MDASLVLQDSINVCSRDADLTVSFTLFNETNGEVDSYLSYCDVYTLREEHHYVAVNTLSTYSKVPDSNYMPGGLNHYSKNQFFIHNNFEILRYPKSDIDERL
jgi:uncharacterized protein (UPF0297 family)